MVQLKKKREEIYSYVLLGLFFFSIINFLFLQPTIIGCNRYFNIFAIMIPIIIGIIIANMLKYLLHPIIVGCKNKKFIMLKKNSPNNT